MVDEHFEWKEPTPITKKELEIWELEIKYMTNLPPGSSGIISVVSINEGGSNYGSNLYS